MRAEAGGVILLGVAALTPLPCCAAQSAPAAAPPTKARVAAKEPDGPASAELRALVESDQKDRRFSLERRAPTEAELARMREEDPKRLARVRELLRQDKVVTASDFENAALLFQHGTTPDDYLIAHELTMVNALKRRGGFDNMLALTQDRFLESVGRRQRFGSQGAGPAGEPAGARRVSPVDADGDFGVTDALRADHFMPPLAALEAKGTMAVLDHADALAGRIRQRMNPKWQAEQAAKPEGRELAALLAEQKQMNETWDRDRIAGYVARLIKAYREDRLTAPEDYYGVGYFLMLLSPTLPREDAARHLLLAHELAGVAALRGHKEAPRLWAESWDRFLLVIGQKQRYGIPRTTRDGKMVYYGGIADSASDTVRRALGAGPLAKEYGVEPFPGG